MNKIPHVIGAQAALAVVLLLCSSLLWAQQFYRYQNAEGQTILDTKIPAQYVNQGYDVIDSSGRLLERVAAVQSIDETESNAVDASGNTEQSDQMLLSSYSTPEEIDAHRLRKIQALEREISIIQTDQRVTQIEIDKALEEKADYESREREVPAEALAHIDQLNLTMVQLEGQLVRRRDEIIATDNEFVAKINRFRQLKAEQQQ